MVFHIDYLCLFLCTHVPADLKKVSREECIEEIRIVSEACQQCKHSASEPKHGRRPTQYTCAGSRGEVERWWNYSDDTGLGR